MTDLPDIIGISGYAGAGKDTLANLLAEKHGYRVAHFADMVREAVRRLDPIVWAQPGTPPVRWAAVCDRFGYAAAKVHRAYGPEFRAVMQRMGTEVGREMFGENVWVDALDRTISPGEKVVVADVRFPNELAWLEAAGGLHVRVYRPGVGPANDHPSETALSGVLAPVALVNDAEPEQMLVELESDAARLARVTA